MLVAFVLRLASDALVGGRVAGEVEHVDSGERHVVQSSDELMAWLRAHATTTGQEQSDGNEAE